MNIHSKTLVGLPSLSHNHARYNLLNELTTVSQGVQTRTFAYDALGRLLSSTTPEAGRVCMGSVTGTTCNADGYDSFSNLLTKTDARGVQSNYIYDSLNRFLGVNYTNVPGSVSAMPNVCKTTGSGSNNANVCLTYGTTSASNNNGRVISMTDPTGSENYTFNNLGQVTQLQKTVGSTQYNLQYAYNLAGELASITYPSGRVLTQNLDAIGRLASIVGNLSGTNTTYASGYAYNIAQQTLGFNYGNNINASFGYSTDRLQLSCLDYSTTNRASCAHDGTSKFGLDYSYGASGANNGQISSITDRVDNGRTATYSYDALYRLVSATTTGSTPYPAWSLAEVYDRYGNRTQQNVVAGGGPPSCLAISTATNQVTGTCASNVGFGTDASGNMTGDGQNTTIIYDGESRTTSSSGSGSGSYIYDGHSLRVKKCVPNCTSPTTTTVYIFSGPKVIAEYVNGAAPATPTREYIYSGATLLAKIESGATKYYHQDHLSNRIVTDSTGAVVAQMGHYPYGESWYNSTNDKLLFTSYERDSESGNDYAVARFDVSRFGRFASVDRDFGAVEDPQSLNRYAYVLNDPCNLTDPLGLNCVLKIGLNNQTLSGTAKDRITTIFSNAGIDVQFVPGNNGTFNVQQNVDLGVGHYGYAGTGQPQINNQAIHDAVFFHGVAIDKADAYQNALGTIISHEIGHLAVPCEHAPGSPDCGTAGLMRPGPEAGEFLVLDTRGIPSNLYQFSQSQIDALQSHCKASKKGPKKGGGGGGRGPLGGSGFNTNCQTIDFGFGWITECGDGSGCGFFIGIAGGCSGGGGFGGGGFGGGGFGGGGGGGGGGCDIFDVSCGRGMGALPPKSVL